MSGEEDFDVALNLRPRFAESSLTFGNIITLENVDLMGFAHACRVLR